MPAILGKGTVAALLLILAAATGFAAEPASVKVELGEDASGQMSITLSTDRIKAGPVEFEVANASKFLVHEFLIAPWKGNPTSLPYDDKVQQVKEDSLKDHQGVEDMPVGQKVTLRLALAPGQYVVFCNQAGHYKNGMFHRFTVTR